MSWLRKLWGLFVDDGAYALAIVLWLLAAWWLLPLLRLAATWNAVVLAAGLLTILVGGVRRSP